jgi:hypothetical protein
MAHLHITPRRVAPYLISGATGVHILTRMRNLSKQPAVETPLHFFLLKHTDVMLTLSGTSVVIWHLAKHKPRQQTPGNMAAALTNGSAVNTSDTSVITDAVHQLRQVFTALLLGLGLIGRKADAGNTAAILDLVKRLKVIVRRGIEAVNVLDSEDSIDGHEREYGI